MNLNPKQKEAIEHKSGPLLIIAGAGTGKTTVITQRIAHILSEKWAEPSEILALTFTEKAAGEMEERVDLAMPYGYDEIWISTFHSFCDRILKQEGYQIGLDSNYDLMTQAQSYIFMRKNLFKLPLDRFRPLGNPTKFIGDLLKHFSRLQDEDISPEKYIEYAKKLKGEEKEQYLELANTYKTYTELKIRNSKLDFGDLIIMVLKLFREREVILKKYQKQFKYILVDEFQDTNHTQNVLVELLAKGKKPNLTVVGDDDQSIYKFRGAAISNILQFNKQYPTAKRVVLTNNYRSKQQILDTAYELIKHNNPYRLEETEGIDKRLVSFLKKKKGESPVSLLVGKNSENEAEKVAKEILKLTGNSEEVVEGKYDEKGQSTFVKNSDGEYDFINIAILVRAHNHSEDIIKALKYYGIPFKFGGSRGLYTRSEVQKLISFLKLLLNYTDEVSMFNILSMTVWGMEPREIIELIKRGKNSNISTFEAIEEMLGISVGTGDLEPNLEENISEIFSEDTVGSLIKIMEIFHKSLHMMKEGNSVVEILFNFFSTSGYLDSLQIEETMENHVKISNIHKYFELVKEYEKQNKNSSVQEYLGYLEYSIEIGETPNVDEDILSDYNAVNIMTVHGAKGLEFPVVFMSNLVSDRFPSRNMSDAIALPDDLISEELPENTDREIHLQEERRLFYVGATRAKEKLYLTAANFYAGGKRRKKPSIFIGELLNRGTELEFEESMKDVATISFEGTPEELIDYEALNVTVGEVVSYSQLRLYERCPRDYKYKYVIKVPTPPNSALSYGSTLHNTLKQLYEQHNQALSGLGTVDLPQKKDLLRMYENNWVSGGYEGRVHESKKKEEGEKVLSEYFKDMYNKDEKIIDIERGFKYKLDDITVRGYIDRVDLIEEKKGKKVVDLIDYKTGKVMSKQRQKEEWQLILYAIVAEEVLGYEVRNASYLFLEHGERIDVKVSGVEKEAVKKKIKELVKGIRSGDFEIKPEHNCMFSDYDEICDDAIL